MGYKKNIRNIGAFIITAALLLASCETYEFDAPDCQLITDVLETPFAYEIEQEPIIILNFGDEVTHRILQRRTENIARIRCPQDRDTCLNYVPQHTYDKLFQLRFKRPKKLEDLVNSIGLETPLLSIDSLENQTNPTTHLGLTIFDSCRTPYEPLDNQSSEIFHNRILEVNELNRTEGDNGNSLLYYIEVEVIGEIKAQYNIQGRTILISGQYRLEEFIVEER